MFVCVCIYICVCVCMCMCMCGSVCACVGGGALPIMVMISHKRYAIECKGKVPHGWLVNGGLVGDPKHEP